MKITTHSVEKIHKIVDLTVDFSIKHDNNINNYFTFCMEWERLSTILL